MMKNVMLFSEAAELDTPRGVHAPPPHPVDRRLPPLRPASSSPLITLVPTATAAVSLPFGRLEELAGSTNGQKGGTSSKKRHWAWQGLGNLKSQDHKNSHKITNETTFGVSLCNSSRPRQGGTQKFT